MNSEFWRAVGQEMLSGLAVAAICAFIVWLRKTHSNLKKIADAFPLVLERVDDHERRLDAHAADIAALKGAGPQNPAPAAEITSPTRAHRV
jgi:hypothetical protein